MATVRPRPVAPHVPTSSLIDIPDIERPDPPPRPVISVRHSNWVNSRPISPSSSRRPVVRRRVVSPVQMPTSDAVSSANHMLHPVAMALLHRYRRPLFHMFKTLLKVLPLWMFPLLLHDLLLMMLFHRLLRM